MNRTPVSLYELLPAYVRFRDAYEGEPLRAILETLQIPFDRIRDGIDDLYEAWFIETCDDWMVPYIGELVGVRGLETPRRLFPTMRARVANALAYRRSKGTPATLERVARDVTGWPCKAIEYRRLVAATPALLDVAATPAATVDLRRAGDLDDLGGPFDVLAHTADFKPSDPANPRLGGGGGYQLLRLGLAFWRLQSYPISGGKPGLVAGAAGAGSCHTFHPLGLDAPLFNEPKTEGVPVYASGERHLPAPLRRRPLAEEIAARRAGRLPQTDYFSGEPVFAIAVASGPRAPFRTLAPDELEICDLADWSPSGPPPGVGGEGAAGRGGARIAALVDPVLGRFVLPGFPPAGEERRVRVSYSYGAAMDLGGGPYPRSGRHEPAAVGWRAVVSRACERRFDPGSKVHYFPSLAEAFDAWNRGRKLPIPPAGREEILPGDGWIQICDSASYGGDLRLDLRGRRLGLVAADGCRPCLTGSLQVLAGAAPPEIWADEGFTEEGKRPTELLVDGLWIAGGLRLAGGGQVTLAHCTIGPPLPGRAEGAGLSLVQRAAPAGAEGSLISIRARGSVLGPLDLGAYRGRVDLADCIVDGGGGRAILGSRIALDLARCTLLGEAAVGQVGVATDTLFAGPLHTRLPSEGVVRYSYLPAGSRTPAQERCQGEGARGPSRIEQSVTPAFVSVSFGHPAYAQLSPASTLELRRGAEDGNEIGVYNRLRQGDRLANLPRALDEFLPWGLAAEIFYVT